MKRLTKTWLLLAMLLMPLWLNSCSKKSEEKAAEAASTTSSSTTSSSDDDAFSGPLPTLSVPNHVQ